MDAITMTHMTVILHFVMTYSLCSIIKYQLLKTIVNA